MTPVPVVVELACQRVSNALAEYPEPPKDLHPQVLALLLIFAELSLFSIGRRYTVDVATRTRQLSGP